MPFRGDPDEGADAVSGTDWSRGVPLMAGEWFIGFYQPSPETAGFWEAVQRRELALKWCAHCAKAFHPKRIVCTNCGAEDLAWRPASGRGRVYSFSEVHRAPSTVFAASVPYTVGLVALDEGVHLFTRFVAEPGPIAIDAPARVDFRVLELGQLLPIFLVGGA
jgi:uncharacterized OB-fold protein